jgi:aconitase A
MSAHLSAFISRIFGIEQETGNYRRETERTRIIFQCKKEFFVRRALKKHRESDAAHYGLAQLEAAIRALNGPLRPSSCAWQPLI